MMIVNDPLLQKYQKSWQAQFEAKPKDWLQTLRTQQFATFLDQGFPNIRHEQWKYTNIMPLAEQSFELTQPSSELNRLDDCEHFFMTGAHYRLVFIDGFFSAELSVTPCNEKFIIMNLAAAIEQHKDLVQKYIAPESNSSAFLNLNTAYIQDGVFIYAPANCVITKPIHVLYLAGSHSVNRVQHIRNIIVAEERANVTFFEEYQSLVQESYTSNVVTQLQVNTESHVEHIKLQNQNTKSFHVSNTLLSQYKNSRVSEYSYSLGGQLAREDICCNLHEEGASLQLAGLYLPLDKQHIDIHTFINHLASHTTSDEVFKGVIAAKSRAVFNGKISVTKKIKQAIANLQNKNLLLAPDAEVNTKPELEIYSDDVKCRHGATISTLDKEMLFYLRSRGISADKAHQLLLLAFVRENVNAITHASIADKIHKLIEHKWDELIS
ncbi:MAG: Fe-S cluster assembly protein SufD [Gammaproteobacteria bacterium]|nr:Fe-S cluster assembly protein SufD [Gammaproteobacteria bacterium]